MSSNNRDIFDAAVALPQKQRLRLVKQLLDSLDDAEELWEEELAGELNRRHQDIAEGKAKPISWAKLKKQLSR